MMNLRESWINRPLFKSIIKNNLFPAKVSLIIFVGFFILASISDDGTGIEQLCIAVFAFSSIVLTTIYPSFIQSYLIDKTKASIVKALPLSSKCIWFTNYLAGYLIILVTLLIEGIGVFLVDAFRSYYSIFMGPELYRFILMIFVLLFIYYTITYLVASMAGNRLGQIVFSIVAYTLPVVLMLSFVLFTTYLVPGQIDQIKNYYTSLVFPLVAGLEYIDTGDLMIFIHCFIALILLVISYYIYINRDDEYIGEPLVFRKIGIILKAGIILIVTVALFYLILLFAQIDITFGMKGIFILLLVYMVVGVIVAIFVEIIFKSTYIYRKLLIYIPILLIFFGINYVFANNQYYQTISNILEKQKISGELYMYSLQNNYNFMMNLDRENMLNLIDYLNDNRDNIHYQQIDENDNMVTFSLFDVSNDNYNEYMLEYCLDQEFMINYFKGLDDDYLTNLSTGFKDEKYLNCYYEGKSLYLNLEKVAQLYQIVKDQKIVPDDLLNGEMININGASGNEYIIKLDEQIKEFFGLASLVEQSEFIENCYNYIYDNNLLTDVDKELAKVVKDELGIRDLTSLYDDEIELLEFNDDYTIYQVSLMALNDDASYDISLELRLEKVNDEIIIGSIRKAGK